MMRNTKKKGKKNVKWISNSLLSGVMVMRIELSARHEN